MLQKPVSNALRRFKMHHTVQHLPQSGRPRTISATDLGHLKTAITKHQIKLHATLHACKTWFEQHHHTTATNSSLYAALHHSPMKSYELQTKAPHLHQGKKKRVNVGDDEKYGVAHNSTLSSSVMSRGWTAAHTLGERRPMARRKHAIAPVACVHGSPTRSRVSTMCLHHKK